MRVNGYDPALREALAELEHDRWSRWQLFLHSRCTKAPDGSLVIPARFAQRWERQTRAAYAELSEREKESDRKEADNTIAVLKRLGQKVS